MTSGDAAEQVVRIALDGTEVALRITGSLAKNAIVALYALLNSQEKTAGATRITSLLKSGKELKLYTIKASDLKKFKEVAKQYGVLYTVMQDKDNTSPNAEVDIWARMEDAPKINRITEKYGFGTVEIASVGLEAEPERQAAPEHTDSTEALLDELLGEEEQPAPLADGRADNGNRSETSSGRSSSERPSVRQELTDIRQEMDSNRESAAEKALAAIEKMSKVAEEVTK